MKIKLALAAAAFALGSASSASAAPILGLFNTGVDALGNKITTDNQLDIHYLVSGLPSYTTSNAAYVASSAASFIASAPGGQGGSAAYTLTFVLAGLDATTATLSGDTAYDNGVVVFLNGTQIYSDVPANPGVVGTFNALHHFTASSSAFVAGVNTLTFRVTDYGQPSGLLVTNLAGTAAVAPVPEPATWALMMLGFGGVGFAMRRRTKVQARIRFA